MCLFRKHIGPEKGAFVVAEEKGTPREVSQISEMKMVIVISAFLVLRIK